MSLPNRDVAKSWVGHRVLDADGDDIGTCVSVYADDATGAPEWLVVERSAGVRALVPIGGATGSGGTVRVSFSAAAVAGAPQARTVGHVDGDEEQRLYDHYGVSYSSAVSSTVLPVGEDGSTEGAGAGTATVGAGAAAGTGASGETPGAQSRTTGTVYTSWPPERSSEGGKRVPLIAGGVAVAAAAVTGAVVSRGRWSRLAARRSKRRARRARARTARRTVQRAKPLAGAGGRAAKAGARAGRASAPVLKSTGWGAVRAVLFLPALGTVAAQRYARPTRDAAGRLTGRGRQAGRQVLHVGEVAGHRVRGGVARVGRPGELVGSGARQLGGTATRVGTSAQGAGSRAVHAVTDPVSRTTHSIATTTTKTWRTTMKTLTAALGFGIGYVLGARAGRERYDQISQKANELAGRPEVQRAKERVTGAVSGEQGGESGDWGDQRSGSSTGRGGGTAAVFPAGATAGATAGGLAGEPLAGEPLAGEPLAGEPIVGDPLAVDPMDTDPLAVDPMGPPSTSTDPTRTASMNDPDIDLTLGAETPADPGWSQDRG